MFIVLEGIDGAGTTTAAKLLHEQLVNSVLTREPNRGSLIGEVIDRWLTNKIKLNEKAGFYLFLADRWQHHYDVILPALEQNKIVICDRYAYSTWVYQQDHVSKRLLRSNLKVPTPDYVFILDLPAEAALARKRGEVAEHFEVLEKQRRYRERYLDIHANKAFRLGAEQVFLIDSQANDPVQIRDICCNHLNVGRTKF